MNHFISLSLASTMTGRYRAQHEAILDPLYQNQAILPLCETFDKAPFVQLLLQPGCSFVRLYYGMDEDLKIHAIIVAADASGQDLLPPSLLTEFNEDNDIIIERGNRCPDLCPPASPLNS